MPNFFVPHAKSSEISEQMYTGFTKVCGFSVVHPNSRLFQITFHDPYGVHVATVDKGISSLRDESGPVLGIIETEDVLCVHTAARGGIVGAPLLIRKYEVTDRVYFDDYPAPT